MNKTEVLSIFSLFHGKKSIFIGACPTYLFMILQNETLNYAIVVLNLE